MAHADSTFGVQLHHPYFLECIGSSVSARLLGRPPDEWLQVKTPQDVLVAAMQLQRDAGLMESNLNVLMQYVTLLHQMSTDVMHTVFGRVPWVQTLSPKWRSWAYGVHHFAREVQCWILFCMMLTARVAPSAVRVCPVDHFEPVYLEYFNCIYVYNYPVELCFSLLSSV